MPRNHARYGSLLGVTNKNNKNIPTLGETQRTIQMTFFFCYEPLYLALIDSIVVWREVIPARTLRGLYRTWQ